MTLIIHFERKLKDTDWNGFFFLGGGEVFQKIWKQMIDQFQVSKQLHSLY